MKSANYNKGIKTHMGMGALYGILAGIVQGSIEGIILLISYNGYIFVPQNIFQFYIFILSNKILNFDRSEGVPFILDKYLGPSFTDKLPFIFNMVATYAIAGLLVGVGVGILIWFVFRLFKKSLDSKQLSIFYVSFILSFGMFVNLIIFLDTKNLISTATISGLLISFILLACGLFLGFFIYKLVCALWKGPVESNKNVSPGIFTLQTKTAVFLVGLIVCATLILNLWVFRDGKVNSEIFAAQINHGKSNNLINHKNSDINIVFISIDSLRADHLSCYGYDRKTSPNIDELASHGVLFSNVSSTTSWTLPSHLSMLTSMYPESHGVIIDDYSLDKNRTTLPELLKKEGYVTAGFVSGVYLNSRFGFDQGFDLYDDFTIGGTSKAIGALVSEITSPRLNTAIQSWLRQNSEKKFFLFLHYFDVHFDYIPPPPYDTMFDPGYTGPIDGRGFLDNPKIRAGMDPRDLFHVIALYDGEIAFTDKYIGELISTLKELDVYDKTLIVLTADHGDEFFEHGDKGHKRTLYEEVLSVPLIFKFPFNWHGDTRIDEIASIVDITPTVLDYLNVEPHQEMQGRSLLTSLNDGEGSDDFLVYAGFENKLVAVKSRDSKLIHNLGAPKKEFYDLKNDPQEKVNIFVNEMSESLPEGEKKMVSLLNWLNAQRWLSRSIPKTDTKKKIELNESEKEQLKALGYIQ